MAKVLMVGLHPDVVDFDKWPGLTAEKLEAGLGRDRATLQDAGLEAEIHWLHDLDAAPDLLAEALSRGSYGVVLIGAGVRKDDDHFLLFERLVNVVHEHAPHARIAFNTGPTDTAAAVGRWT